MLKLQLLNLLLLLKLQLLSLQMAGTSLSDQPPAVVDVAVESYSDPWVATSHAAELFYSESADAVGSLLVRLALPLAAACSGASAVAAVRLLHMLLRKPS